MEIKGKVYCFFEQSGTFKNEFRKLGYDAVDADIQDNFGETDYIIDLFQSIEDAYEGVPTLFDAITNDDLIMAFFPCIYFCANSQVMFSFTERNYKNLTPKKKCDAILERSKKREYFFSVAVKMFSVAEQRGLRLIMENPWSGQTFLKANFVMPPAIIDNDRSLRGDYFRKPTAYWFINCEPTSGYSYQPNPHPRRVVDTKRSGVAGVCSEERSMISPEYARNFICDFIVGRVQPHTQLELWK